jgi:hypothetical protein
LGCETWSLKFREEHRLIVFDNEAQRTIFRHVTHMGEKKNEYSVLVGSLKESVHLEDPDVDGIILLKWILQK